MDFVPAGYTAVAQPIDVGINSPFKKLYKSMHDNWFLAANEQAIQTKSRVKVPACHVVAQWALTAWDSIKIETVKKSWIHISTQANQQVAVQAKSDAMEAALALAMLSLVPPVVTANRAGVNQGTLAEPPSLAHQVCNDDHNRQRGLTTVPTNVDRPHLNDADVIDVDMVNILSEPLTHEEMNLFEGILV